MSLVSPPSSNGWNIPLRDNHGDKFFPHIYKSCSLQTEMFYHVTRGFACREKAGETVLHRVVTTRLFTLGSSLPPWLLARYYGTIQYLYYTAQACLSLVFTLGFSLPLWLFPPSLKGPKHDQIECGFFYIKPTSMGW